MKTFFKYQLPPLVWVIAIYLLAAIPGLRLEIKSAPGIDKIEHAFLYFILCGLARRAFIHQEMLPALKRSALLGAFFFSSVFGALEEYHQNFIIGRENDPYNVLANIAGALLFVSIAWLLHQDEKTEDENRYS